MEQVLPVNPCWDREHCGTFSSVSLMYPSPSESSSLKACLISAMMSQSFIFLHMRCANCWKSTTPPTSFT